MSELKIYVLTLNPMRGNTENCRFVAASMDKQKVIDYYNSFLVEPYSEEGEPSFEVHGSSHTWRKSFKKGSPLEWLNPHDYGFDKLSPWGHGIREYTFLPEEYEETRRDMVSRGIVIL